MPLRILEDGRSLLVLEFSENGKRWPVADFLDPRNGPDIPKILKLLAFFGENGLIFHPQKNKPIEGQHGLFEFKAFQARIPYCQITVNGRPAAVCLMGFLKKKDKLDREDVDKAVRLKSAVEAQLKVAASSDRRNGR